MDILVGFVLLVIGIGVLGALSLLLLPLVLKMLFGGTE